MPAERRRLIPAALAVLVLAACNSGGGDGGGGPTPPTAPGPAIVFTPDRSAGSNSISMRVGDGSTATVLQLEIFATEVLNVQLVEFVLLNPNSRLRFDGFTRGEFIGAGAQVIVGGGGNALSFEVLRVAPSAASGSGRILTLTFSAVAAGNGRFDFVDPVAEDPFGLEIPGIDWIGGAVQVIR